MADEGAAPLLPELARSLRTLGRPRDDAAEVAHDVVFVPLLEARARAARGDAAETVFAFDGAALASNIDRLASDAARAGQAEAARGRARVAAARELLEPLDAALARLDTLSGAAVSGGTQSDEWARWAAQLRQVFSVADDACGAMARLLAADPDPADTPARRWFGRRRGTGE